MLKKRNFKFKGLLGIFGILMVLAIGLLIERNGVSYKNSQSDSYYLKNSQVKTKTTALSEVNPTTLLIYDSRNESSAEEIDNFKQIFEDMKVATSSIDLAKEEIPAYRDFETVVVLTPNLEPLDEGGKLLDLLDWVEEGGNVLFAMTIENDDLNPIIKQKMGILSSSEKYAVVDSVYIEKGFMLGDQQSYTIDDPFESAWKVQLDDQAKVHMRSGDQQELPLVWSYELGQGRVVVDNFGLYDKTVRGFYSASYSLLDEVGIYPVINSSSFTIDDFPAPVPSGNAEYVSRDYQMNVSDFYINIWWPDMIKLSNKHGLRYTGVVIENYEDDTSDNIVKQGDISRFNYFGNMLLQMGGEIGYHGYNHQPFSLSNVDYGEIYDYNTWKDQQAAENSLNELIRFTDDLFPNVEKSVYVPPSNILSAEGRKMLASEYPHIRVIASNYFDDAFTYVQEFGVSEDGMIEEPRISSGTIIDDYMKLTMVSELNLHLVSHHFIHPDDPLDVERGAKLGWEQMFKNLSDKYDWLYKSAPSIRNLTESQMGGAIQRFSSITVSKEVSQSAFTFKLGNLVDEAYLLVRINDGEIGQVKGGSLEKLDGNLYLLHATNKTVSIERK